MRTHSPLRQARQSIQGESTISIPPYAKAKIAKLPEPHTNRKLGHGDPILERIDHARHIGVMHGRKSRKRQCLALLIAASATQHSCAQR
jgi:hypothetical protein